MILVNTFVDLHGTTVGINITLYHFVYRIFFLIDALGCLLPEDGKTVITPSSILFKMCFLVAFCLSDKTAGSCPLQIEDEMELMISLLMQLGAILVDAIILFMAM